MDLKNETVFSIFGGIAIIVAIAAGFVFVSWPLMAHFRDVVLTYWFN